MDESFHILRRIFWDCFAFARDEGMKVKVGCKKGRWGPYSAATMVR